MGFLNSNSTSVEKFSFGGRFIIFFGIGIRIANDTGNEFGLFRGVAQSEKLKKKQHNAGIGSHVRNALIRKWNDTLE